MTMGLGQTLAFYLAKGEPHHLQLARALACWLLEDPEADGTKLLKVITEGSAAKYRRLTTEALAYVTWLKRLAKAKHSEQNSEQKIDS
jgi:CRISPR type III-B/RAMP module-associated protein Cmr5